MGSKDCYVRRFAKICRIGLVYGNATRLLRKSADIAIAKLETHMVATNGTSNRRQLLLSLKLRSSTIESRCRKSGEISECVAGL